MYLCKTKARNEWTPEVKAKARAAVQWCKAANDVSEKPWSYLLIPHDDVQPNMELARSVERYLQGRERTPAEERENIQ
jgi:type III restriction enzyme